MADSARLPERKRIRLDGPLYREPGIVASITIGAHHRRPIFKRSAFTDECITLLEQRSGAMNVAVLAFCFMPDHLHLLLEIYERGDVVAFVRDFKSRATRVGWEHGLEGRVWQRSFYDHILRENDDPLKHLRYILENPVRKEIVEHWARYPFSGSFVYEVDDATFWR